MILVHHIEDCRRKTNCVLGFVYFKRSPSQLLIVLASASFALYVQICVEHLTFPLALYLEQRVYFSISPFFFFPSLVFLVLFLCFVFSLLVYISFGIPDAYDPFLLFLLMLSFSLLSSFSALLFSSLRLLRLLYISASFHSRPTWTSLSFSHFSLICVHVYANFISCRQQDHYHSNGLIKNSKGLITISTAKSDN